MVILQYSQDFIVKALAIFTVCKSRILSLNRLHATVETSSFALKNAIIELIAHPLCCRTIELQLANIIALYM